MDAAVLGGVHRAPLETVPAEHIRIKPRGTATRFHDPGDRPGIDRLGADHQDWLPLGGWMLWPRRHPDASEQRAFGDTGGLLPAAQRAHRTEVAATVGDPDDHALARPI